MSRAKEGLPRENIHVDAGLFIIPILIAKSGLCSIFLSYLIGERRELSSELLFLGLFISLPRGELF